MSEAAICPECDKKNWDVHELCPYEDTYECEFCGETFFLRVQPSINVETFQKTGENE